MHAITKDSPTAKGPFVTSNPSLSTRQAKHLAFALLVITAGVNLQAPLYAAYAKSDGVGVFASTLAFACYVAGILPVLLALGGFSDRIGRRPVMLIALLLSALGSGLVMLHPHLVTVAGARFMLGVGTALMSATATAYMIELLQDSNTTRAATWVTASTAFGFGLGPALTSVCLMFQDTFQPLSFWVHLLSVGLALSLIRALPETVAHGDVSVKPPSPMLRLPHFTCTGVWYGSAILLCWSVTGVVISVLPSTLAKHGLSHYSGLFSMAAISGGFFVQPLARKMKAKPAVYTGLLLLPCAYALLAYGAYHGWLMLVLLGALVASTSCYGFVYLGGLAGVTESAGTEKTRASAGYFLMAYFGLSLPVILMGVLVDHYGMAQALVLFGFALFLGVGLLLILGFLNVR
jgi:predicted MFS family arabinose efflux permease